MNRIFDEATNYTNVTVNLSNIGQAPAFNIFLDIFDNTTYENNRSISFLNNSETIVYNFSISNTSNATLITVLADFNNLVDESNESNNIAQNTILEVVSLDIESITIMYSNATLKIFEFVILNDGETAVTDVEWQFDTNDNKIINSTSNITSLAANEKAFVYLQHNFSGTGSYNVKANATGLRESSSVTSSLSSTVSIGDLIVSSFDDLSVQGTNVIFEIQAKNN